MSIVPAWPLAEWDILAKASGKQPCQFKSQFIPRLINRKLSLFMWSFLSFRKFKQQNSVLHLQVLARSRGIMSYSNNRNDLSGECFRKPSPPPTPNNRTAWNKIQATWDAYFLRTQAGRVQALALTLFSALARFPDAQWCHAGCCSQAVRWELSRESCFTEVAFLYVEFEWIQRSRQCRLECVCCLPTGGKKNEGKNYRDFVFCSNWGDSMAADHSCLWLYKARSRSVGNWSFFLCLNLWLLYLRNTGEWPGQAKCPLSEWKAENSIFSGSEFAKNTEIWVMPV